MVSTDNLPVIILGGGGHASVLAEICIEQGRQILAVVSPEANLTRPVFKGLRHIKNDNEISNFSIVDVELVNGVGGLPGSTLRRSIAEAFSQRGYRFATVVAPTAVVSSYVALSEGVQIFPGAIVNGGSFLGHHSIVNTGAVVEHDCTVEDYVQIGPNSVICGQVTLKKGCIIGPGAVVGSSLIVGQDTVVGAGASVVRSIGRSKKLIPAPIRMENNKL